MDNDTKSCSQCGQKDRCGLVYKQLGDANGPTVTWKVIVAFLIPLLVFILSLAGIDKLLQGQLEGKPLLIVSVLTAVVVTLIVVFLIRAVFAHRNKPL